MTLDLEAEAKKFGDELQQLLDAVLPYQAGVDPLRRQVTVTDAGLSFAIEFGTAGGQKAQTVPLLRGGEKVAELYVRILLRADSADRYPAVAKSEYALRIERHPILRLDFYQHMHTVPCCHWNVHAERSALTALLVRNKPDHSGDLAKVHLPVGGVRNRPSIEDFLQLLVNEVGFDAQPGAQVAIEEGRVRWRRRQLAAMVRDDAEEAARVLRELGYDVAPPASGPRPSRTDRLTTW